MGTKNVKSNDPKNRASYINHSLQAVKLSSEGITEQWG